MDSSEALLNLVWVPWQIIVDHKVSALKVYTFARCVVSDQHQHVSVLHEPLNYFSALFSCNTAVNDLYGFPFSKSGTHFSRQIVKRIFRFGKNDQLAPVSVCVDHQIVIEYPVELSPLRIFSRP